MKKLLYFAFILLLINNLFCFAERIVKYNPEKQHYEVWDEETGELIMVLRSIERETISQEKNINLFPYQQGWPVQTPSAVYYPLTIGELTGDDKLEVYALTLWDGHYIYDYLGNVIFMPNYGGIAAFKDIDFDGLNEIIGNQGLDPPNCIDFCGATVAKCNGIRLNGFPNPPNTAFFGASIEDIDRDGNYEIAFAASEPSNLDEYNLGMNVLGSWGGLLPGFPVVFPLHTYEPPVGAGYSYASPSLGDFDGDGMLEISANTGNGKLYLIKSDGSHFRNWPIVLWAHPTNPPVFGDIDNDGKLELAITDATNYNKLFVFNDDASLVPGFPVSYGYGPAYSNPSLADVNGDGNLELYVLSLCDRLIAFNNDGTILPGWPIFLRINNKEVSFSHFPSVADIDGDGEMELIAAGGTCEWCPDGVLIAYNFDGSIVDGFPIIEPYYGFIDIGPTLADLDNDGDIEICTGSEYCDKSEHYAHIYCYDLPYAYDETKIAWNNYAHDNQHTARYVNPAVKPPIVEQVQPNSSSYKGGHMVKITGQNFLPGAKVFFDGVPSTEVQVADSTTLFAKVPPHKPCFRYINDLSVSPYHLSFELANQSVIDGSKFKDIENLEGTNPINSINLTNPNSNLSPSGCIVNVVVVHPSPDQREGILRAGFTYTGYEPPTNDITLFVSKYSPMGTFENNAANWIWITEKGLWNII